MKRMVMVLMLTMVMLVGCGLKNSRYIYYSFSPGMEMTTNVGSPMIEVKQVCQNDVYKNILDSFELSLIYSGKQGKVIKIVYRELSNNMARPAFSQELTYDLADDSTIVFRSTKIKVLNATNSSIQFVVLESPAYRYKPGDKTGSCGTR